MKRFNVLTEQRVHGCVHRKLASSRKPPVPEQKLKQPTGAGLRDKLARQVSLAKLAVRADESKSNNWWSCSVVPDY